MIVGRVIAKYGVDRAGWRCDGGGIAQRSACGKPNRAGGQVGNRAADGQIDGKVMDVSAAAGCVSRRSTAGCGGISEACQVRWKRIADQHAARVARSGIRDDNRVRGGCTRRERSGFIGLADPQIGSWNQRVVIRGRVISRGGVDYSGGWRDRGGVTEPSAGRRLNVADRNVSDRAADGQLYGVVLDVAAAVGGKARSAARLLGRERHVRQGRREQIAD